MLKEIRAAARDSGKFYSSRTVVKLIIEYKVTDLGNDFYIAVASTLEKYVAAMQSSIQTNTPTT